MKIFSKGLTSLFVALALFSLFYILALLADTSGLLKDSRSVEKIIQLTESQFLILTERAFLEGYKASLMDSDRDSSWQALSDYYSGVFDNLPIQDDK